MAPPKLLKNSYKPPKTTNKLPQALFEMDKHRLRDEHLRRVPLAGQPTATGASAGLAPATAVTMRTGASMQATAAASAIAVATCNNK